MLSVPKQRILCLFNIGRRSSGLEVRMRSPPSLAYF
jgi:hypothetical protein